MVLAAAFFSAGFAEIKDFILLDKAKCTDEASEILWRYILKSTKLTEKTAEFHNIYKKDCAAVFYDLDDDGVDEIIGTHHSSASRHPGSGILYILKKEKTGYDEIGYRILFSESSPIYVLEDKTKGFHNLKCQQKGSALDSVFIYSKNIDKYVLKEKQKALEKEFKERFF